MIDITAARWALQWPLQLYLLTLLNIDSTFAEHNEIVGYTFEQLCGSKQKNILQIFFNSRSWNFTEKFFNLFVFKMKICKPCVKIKEKLKFIFDR